MTARAPIVKTTAPDPNIGVTSDSTPMRVAIIENITNERLETLVRDIIEDRLSD